MSILADKFLLQLKNILSPPLIITRAKRIPQHIATGTRTSIIYTQRRVSLTVRTTRVTFFATRTLLRIISRLYRRRRLFPTDRRTRPFDFAQGDTRRRRTFVTCDKHGQEYGQGYGAIKNFHKVPPRNPNQFIRAKYSILRQGIFSIFSTQCLLSYLSSF